MGSKKQKFVSGRYTLMVSLGTTIKHLDNKKSNKKKYAATDFIIHCAFFLQQEKNC